MVIRIAAVRADSCDPHNGSRFSARRHCITSPHLVNREARRVSKAVRRRRQVRVGTVTGRAEAYVRFLSSESNHLLAFSHYRQHSCSERCTHNSLAPCFSFIMTGLLKGYNIKIRLLSWYETVYRVRFWISLYCVVTLCVLSFHGFKVMYFLNLTESTTCFNTCLYPLVQYIHSANDYLNKLSILSKIIKSWMFLSKVWGIWQISRYVILPSSPRIYEVHLNQSE